jgi:hypothetical protein
MGSAACRLDVRAPRREGPWLLLEAELRVADLAPRSIRFEVETPDDRLPARDGRPFVLASLVAAMRAGLPLEVNAPLDRTSRLNLSLWQAAFAGWRPALMSRIPLLAPDAPEPTRAEGCVTAFSGGADSHHTLAQGPKAGLRVDAGAMVQGFDIPLADDAAFARAFARAARTLERHGARAHRIRTNIRSLDKAFHLSWQHETHGPYLAAALACLAPWYGSAIIPASFGHEHPVLPWGSNALTDPFLGGAAQTVAHHGAELMRIDKLLHLATDADFARSARVCYLNAEKDANCGRCYKCATLQVAFWASGLANPEAFPIRATLDDLAGARLPKPSYIHTFRVLAERAERAGLGEVAAALRTALARAGGERTGMFPRFMGWMRRLPMRG